MKESSRELLVVFQRQVLLEELLNCQHRFLPSEIMGTAMFLRHFPPPRKSRPFRPHYLLHSIVVECRPSR
jgi:hypothetical protein